MVTRSTNYLEFIKFHNLLMDSAPEGYVPFYFPVKKLSKDPDSFAIAKRSNKELYEKYTTCKNEKEKKKISSMIHGWTQPHARLNFDEVVDRLKSGGNVGLSARRYDELNIIDIDDFDYLNQLPKIGLVNISRRRTGRHHFSWMMPEEKQNITTEYGEIRSCDQYVVCAGSFVPTTAMDIVEDVCESTITNEQLNIICQDKNKGLYSLHKNSEPPCWMNPSELPEFFRKQLIKDGQNIITKRKKKDTDLILPKNHSALFTLKISDIVGTATRLREGHPLHSSDTNANWSITDDGCLGQCWRHLVSLNAIQYLCVKSGYKTCKEAGVGHKGGSPSEIEGDIKAIWVAWYEAKKCKYIPINDPVPVKAMWWIALKHELVDEVDLNKIMKSRLYNKIIKIIKEEY